MITLKAFLPNPVGPDKEGEYVAVFNNGSEAVSLSGWSIKDRSGKSFSLSGYTIPAGKELRFFSSVTKLSLNNSNEAIYLYQGGQKIDELVLGGSAVEGQPVMRFTELTPAMQLALFDNLAGRSLPDYQAPTSRLVTFWLATAIVLALAAVLVMRTIKEDVRSEQLRSGASGDGFNF
jgi:hypothetical protein